MLHGGLKKKPSATNYLGVFNMEWTISGIKIDSSTVGITEITPLETLYEFDGPKIFTLSTLIGNFIAYLCDEDEDTQRFILAPTSISFLDDLKAGNITVFEALNQSWVWVVDTDYQWMTKSIYSTCLADLPQAILPKPTTMLWSHLQPIFSIRMIGNNLKKGSIPASVIKQAVDSSIAFKCLADSISGNEQRLGRPGNHTRFFYDLPTQHLAFRSFQVSFRKPETVQIPIDLDISNPDPFDLLGEKLFQALEWASGNKDVEIDLSLLKALEKLVPPTSGVIEKVEIKGQLIEKYHVQAFILDRSVTKKVRSALSVIRDKEEIIVVITGFIRELDKDKNQFTLRDTYDQIPRVCFFEDALYEQVMELFTNEESRVKVSGRNSSQKQNSIEVSEIARIEVINTTTKPEDY